MIDVIDNVTLYPETSTLLAIDSKVIFEDNNMTPVTIDKHIIAPWGTDNNLPAQILEKVRKSDIVSANLRFNRDVCYGLGPKLVKVIRDTNKKIVDYVEVEDGPEYEFLNNVS